MVAKRISEEHADSLVVAVELTRGETDTLRHEAIISSELIDSLLWALGMLRTGLNLRAPNLEPPAHGDWLRVIADLARLRDHAGGALDAAIKSYVESAPEVSLERLQGALKCDRERVQEILSSSPGREPDKWEIWASSPASVHPSRYRVGTRVKVNHRAVGRTDTADQQGVIVERTEGRYRVALDDAPKDQPNIQSFSSAELISLDSVRDQIARSDR